MKVSIRSRRSAALVVALATVGVLFAVLGGAPLVTAETSQVTTTVAITPSQIALDCGATTLVDVRVNDVKDLYGIDFKITFDPNILEVVDADAAIAGVQIRPGNLPDTSGGQGFIQSNKVDNAAGNIEYAAVRTAPAAPQSGSGVAASITFRGKGAGKSPITVAKVLLLNQLVEPIKAEPVNGQATVTCAGPTVPATTVPPKPTPPPATPVPKPPKPGQPPVPPPGGCLHTVAPGDTLYSIARRYGATVSELVAINRLADANRIYVGQVLVIPRCAGPVPPAQCIPYVVMPGDTLISIAARHCDSVYGIAVRNGIVNPDCIYAGQVIQVCPACTGGKPPCRSQYVVQPCDTLFSIALRFGVPIQVLVDANNIANPHLIYAGQVLCIPN